MTNNFFFSILTNKVYWAREKVYGDHRSAIGKKTDVSDRIWNLCVNMAEECIEVEVTRAKGKKQILRFILEDVEDE